MDQYSKLTDKLLKTLLGSNLQGNATVDSTTLAGLPADERSFLVKQPLSGTELGVKQIFTVSNNKAYVITYAAELPKFFDYLPILQQVVKSFQISQTS